MELNTLPAADPPRHAASVVMLRDGADGLEVFLLRRHGSSDVLGGAYVFPGGKLDKADAELDPKLYLDQPVSVLHASLHDAELDVATGAGLYVAAVREAFEESGVLFADRAADTGPADIERLLADPGIIRSRAKIAAAIGNARAYLAMQQAGEDFSRFCWDFVGGTPLVWEGAVPPNSPLSAQVSRALKQRGFTFVGPTIVFAWMEATGLIDSHAAHCFRRG